MSVQSWAALIVSICTIVAFAAGSIKWLVKHYLNELRPNSGSSLKDQVTRLESQQKDATEDRKDIHHKLDRLYETMLEFMANNKK